MISCGPAGTMPRLTEQTPGLAARSDSLRLGDPDLHRCRRQLTTFACFDHAGGGPRSARPAIRRVAHFRNPKGGIAVHAVHAPSTPPYGRHALATVPDVVDQ